MSRFFSFSDNVTNTSLILSSFASPSLATNLCDVRVYEVFVHHSSNVSMSSLYMSDLSCDCEVG